jgi:two-component system NtrC family sensor kinase
MTYSNYGPSLIKTIKERCRVCYTCVRECPAKAIRVAVGQAEVIDERCIGCGNCVRVCSQRAKAVRNSIRKARQLLATGHNVVACIAPSFPAEFTEYTHTEFSGILRALGFARVVETSFGADLVARAYKKLAEENSGRHYIASTCPAIVSFIEKYYPHLIENLAPILSPMGAAALVVKKTYGEDTKIVFIGPCVAKKNEADKIKKIVEIDAVLTFSELRMIIEEKIPKPHEVEQSDFDPPRPTNGFIFPIGGGLLQASDIEKNLFTNEIISTEGNRNFVEVIKDFAASNLSAKLLDILCCEGCIMGPGMTVTETRYARQERISGYARLRNHGMDPKKRSEEIDNYSEIPLERVFENDDKRLEAPSPDIIKTILKKMGKTKQEDELNCGACGYETCIEHAIAIHKGFAESEMCLPYTIDKFKENAKELSLSYKQLEETQTALIQSEKLASMGQLAAGIAHEINNPLGVILLYAHLLHDHCDPGSQIHDDLAMIVEQADRCKTIVGGLLNFARKNKAVLKKADISDLVLRCTKALKTTPGIEVSCASSGGPCTADIDVDQIMQVFINIFTNAIEAMPRGGSLSIDTTNRNGNVEIRVTDTGVGIKPDHIKKIFEPFFTTKQMGKGTGLGLAVTYGIIKMHRGNIDVVSNADPEAGPTGSTFIVSIPVNQEET